MCTEGHVVLHAMEIAKMDSLDSIPHSLPQTQHAQRLWLRHLVHEMVDAVWQPFDMGDVHLAQLSAEGDNVEYPFCYCLQGASQILPLLLHVS